MNKLFHIQDSDRPIWVVATDWQDALNKWRKLIVEENGDDEASANPDGIEWVCDSNELLITDTVESDDSL